MMKKYSKYRDAKIPLLNEIPNHWELIKLRFIGDFSSSGIDKNIVEGESLVKIINYTDVYSNSSKLLDSKKEYMVVSCPDSKLEQHLVEKGDLIFTPSSETVNEIGFSALVDEDLENTSFSYHVIRFKFKRKVDHHFKKYLCNNPYVLNYFSAESTGSTRKILDRGSFKNAIVALPPIEEQIKIAQHLDHQTAIIDQLILQKEKLIELLKEKRQAVINEAVTKGLNPNAKMKDSGIEWLGEVPELWKVVKLKHVVDMKSGNFISADMIEDEGPYPVYGGNGLRGYHSEYTHEGYFPLIGRQGALCGNINYAQGKFWPTEHAVVVSPKKQIDTYWLGELLRIMNLNQYSQASAQPGLSVEKIISLSIPFPSFEEQAAIASKFKSMNEKFDLADFEIMESISKLKEYRQSIISEAVTGKIDVRNWQSNDQRNN